MTRASLHWKREYNNYRHASSDENKACFTAIEAGKLILIIHTYSSTKITRVSLQSKVDELISMLTRILRRKITRVSPQSKLDELMSLLHTLTRGIRVDNDISSSSFDCNDRAYSRYFRRRIRVDNDISSSSFHCNDTRIIFIAEYVSTF